MKKRLTVSTLMLAILVWAQAAGDYKGSWASKLSGSTGKLAFTFQDSGLSAASFSIQGQEVKAALLSSKSDGKTTELTFDYDLDGNNLRTKMQGTVTAHALKGTYQTVPAAGGSPVDEGTWEVTRQ